MPGWESGATDVGDCPGSGWGSAENCGMDRQTLRDWAHRYNAEGVSGLFNRRPPDPPCLLSAAQKEKWFGRVPTPKPMGLLRIDLDIEERIGVMHERTVGKQLASLGFRRLSARPQHPRSDPDARGF